MQVFFVRVFFGFFRLREIQKLARRKGIDFAHSRRGLLRRPVRNVGELPDTLTVLLGVVCITSVYSFVRCVSDSFFWVLADSFSVLFSASWHLLTCDDRIDALSAILNCGTNKSID